MKQFITSSSIAKSLVRPLLKKPWDCPYMEFRYGLWTGISGLMGEDGRQLGEANTKPAIFMKDIPAEVLACKYKGTRNGQLINMSALRVAMQHFYETSAITVAVRDYHMARINQPTDTMPGAWDLYVISRAAIALISHQYRYDFGKGRSSAEIPNDVSSLYKLVTGVFVICREMMRVAHPAIASNTPIPSQDLYAFADENYIFRSDNQMVCAGSTTKIIEFLDFANLGHQHPQSAKLPVANEADHSALLGRIVADLGNWYHYALLTVELDHYIELNALRRKLEDEPDAREQTQAALEICEAQYTYWLELLGDHGAYGAGVFEQGILERQNAILKVLKRPPVKMIPTKMLYARQHQ